MASSCPDVLQFARLGAVGRRGPPLRKLAQQAVHKRAIEQRHCLPWANEQIHSRECTPCGQWACYARSQQPKARGVPNHPGRGTAQAVEKSGSERPAWVVEIIGVGSRSTRLRACSVCIVVALWAPPSGSRKWMEVLGRMRVLADRAATQSLAVRLHLRGGRLRHPS